MVRAEMEVPWSSETVERVVSELKIPHQSPSNAGQTNLLEPIELLKSKGLVPIQHRETQRQVRDVALGSEGSPVLAELDIDSVLYDFDGQKISIFEVEVESKSEKGQNVVKSVTKSLKGEYGPILRSWRHGKLATGKGIAKLLKSGELPPLIDAENRLLPAAYDRLNRIL